MSAGIVQRFPSMIDARRTLLEMGREHFKPKLRMMTTLDRVTGEIKEVPGITENDMELALQEFIVGEAFGPEIEDKLADYKRRLYGEG